MISPSAYDVARQTLLILLPELLILLVAIAMMTAAPFVRLPRRAWSATSALTLLAALVALVAVRHHATDLYTAVALNDAFSFYARLVLVLTGAILLAMAHDQVDDARSPEFFGAFLMINAGGMMVAAANELVFLFVGLELVSIPTYLLLYLPRRNASTQEAATKYFFLSLFSSGLLLYGLAFLYGLTGVSNLKALAYLAAHASGVPQPQMALIAAVFIIAGLGFRVAAVPFHFYAPDVYEGSPTVIAALLAWIPKAIGFLAIVRTLTAVIATAGGSGTGTVADRAVVLAWIVAVVTMTLGNTVALLQENLKRLLAYSSIAHAGYLMIAVAVAFHNSDPTRDFSSIVGLLFYLVAYALMTLGAFGVILALSTPDRAVETVDDLAGLGRTHPVTAAAMALCLFSLTGIPPLAGFWGKFYIFGAALDATPNESTRLFQGLAVIGAINAAIGAYYYLRIVVVMYLRTPPALPIAPRTGWPTTLAVWSCAGLSLILGCLPAPIARAGRQAAEAAVALPDPEPAPAPIAAK